MACPRRLRQVEQVGITVAVNWWHDLTFSHLYVLNRAVSDVASVLKDAFEECRE